MMGMLVFPVELRNLWQMIVKVCYRENVKARVKSEILVLCVKKLCCFVVTNCRDGVICVNVCRLLFEWYHPHFLLLNLTLDRKLWTQSEEGSLNQNSKIHDELRVSYGHRRHQFKFISILWERRNTFTINIVVAINGKQLPEPETKRSGHCLLKCVQTIVLQNTRWCARRTFCKTIEVLLKESRVCVWNTMANP